jgi:tetratricopeptide (TPR) repeat protein
MQPQEMVNLGRFTGILALILVFVFALNVVEPVLATGLGMTGPVVTRNSVYYYCQSHGGYPQSGKCYFPDGSYCDLWAFFNGTCPSRETIEQSMWDAEVNQFLNGDDYYSNCPSCVQSSNTATYWMNQANSYYLAGSYQNAVTMYSRALSIDPTLTEAWLNLGNSLYFLGRYDESVAAYDQVVKLDPQNPNAWQGRGMALQKLNRTDEAKNDLEKANSLLSSTAQA